jgi:hypothetical protein
MSLVSPTLILQTRQILLANDIMSSFLVNRRERGKHQYILSVSRFGINRLSPGYKFNIPSRTKRYHKFTDKYVFLRIRKLVHIDNYNDIMYDIEVEQDHSFMANGLASHNCQFHSMGRGTPTVSSAYYGTAEFMNESNSFPVTKYSMVPVRQPVSFYRDFMNWADPDEGECVEQLRRAVRLSEEESPELTTICSNAERVKEDYSVKALAGILKERLEGIRGEA